MLSSTTSPCARTLAVRGAPVIKLISPIYSPSRNPVEDQFIISVGSHQDLKVPAHHNVHMLTRVSLTKEDFPDSKLTISNCVMMRSSSSVGRSVKNGMRASKFVDIVIVSILHETA